MTTYKGTEESNISLVPFNLSEIKQLTSYQGQWIPLQKSLIGSYTAFIAGSAYTRREGPHLWGGTRLKLINNQLTERSEGGAPAGGGTLTRKGKQS